MSKSGHSGSAFALPTGFWPSSAAPILGGAGYAVVPIRPPEIEGGRAPIGAGAQRRTRDPPRGRADLRFAGDRQPITPAGAPFGAPPRLFQRNHWFRISSGPRFREHGIGAAPVQQAPCGAVLLPPGRSPGAARVLGYKPSPRGPHLAPSSGLSLEDTPRGQDGEYIHRAIVKSQGL